MTWQNVGAALMVMAGLVAWPRAAGAQTPAAPPAFAFLSSIGPAPSVRT